MLTGLEDGAYRAINDAMTPAERLIKLSLALTR